MRESGVGCRSFEAVAVPRFSDSRPPTPHPLVMTCRAARQLLNVVLPHQLRADALLIICDVRHVEDLAARTDELLRRAVAAQAPLHRQRRGLIRQRHHVDPAVAARASDPFSYMDGVIEM